jgi:hypothetical protein
MSYVHVIRAVTTDEDYWGKVQVDALSTDRQTPDPPPSFRTCSDPPWGPVAARLLPLLGQNELSVTPAGQPLRVPLAPSKAGLPGGCLRRPSSAGTRRLVTGNWFTGSLTR